MYRFNPANSEGRDSEDKGPFRSMCDQGHRQQGNDPRGLSTPEGVAGAGDPEGIATPMGTTTGVAQGILGTLDRKVRRHRARIEKDGDACKACQGINCEELSSCLKYLSLSPCKRLAIVKNHLYCYLCLSKYHMSRDCIMGTPQCSLSNCKEIFNPLLHWHRIPRIPKDQRRQTRAAETTLEWRKRQFTLAQE